MNWIDLLISLPVISGVYKGYKRGVLSQAASLFIWVFGLYISKLLSPYTSRYIQAFHLVDLKYIDVISIIINFLLLIIVVYLGRKIIERLLGFLFINKINKIIGGVVGGIRSFIFVGVIAIVLSFVIQFMGAEGLKEKLNESIFFQAILNLSTSFY